MAKRLKRALVIIDPQVDFMGHADGRPFQLTIKDSLGRDVTYTASLPVAGAVEDMERLCDLIEAKGHEYDGIFVTLDSHHPLQIFHPAYWRDAMGQPVVVDPAQGKFPFQIKSANIRSGLFTPFNAQFRYRGINPFDPNQPFSGLDWSLYYTDTLEANGRDSLTVWTNHCIIGKVGYSIYPRLAQVLFNWAVKYGRRVQFKPKGENMFTECYGGLKAEVEVPGHKDTVMDMGFIALLQQYDMIDLAGEASSHCVLNTVDQIVDNIGASYLDKLGLLTDAMSPVPLFDFPKRADDFIVKMKQLGLQTATTLDRIGA